MADTRRMVAALFVDPKGVYSGLDGVDLWDEKRDARTYAGPHPVVAHPPCARWSRLAGFSEWRWGRKRGEDGGCFEAAVRAVHTYGGVLEHPAYSAAWAAFDLPRPVRYGGWQKGMSGGWSCHVEQGRYGHPVKKATWLYVFGTALPRLRWGFTLDTDGHAEGSRTKDSGGREVVRIRWTGGHGNSAATPPAFAQELVAIARSVKR